MHPFIRARTSRCGIRSVALLPRRALPALLVATVAACGISGCAQQFAYNDNPICREARQKCQAYHRTLKITQTDEGAGMALLREDCEASQRACAEGVSRSLETSYPDEPGKRKTSFWDY